MPGAPPPYQPYYGASAQTGPAPGWTYAGFGPRFGAYLLDGLIVGVVAVVLVVLFGAYDTRTVVTSTGNTFTTFRSLTPGGDALVGVLLLLYFGGSWWASGRTLGQRAVGLHVSQVEDGARPSAERALIRAAWFAGGTLLAAIHPALGVLGLISLVGMLTMLGDARRQGWHDKTARTVVIRRAG